MKQNQPLPLLTILFMTFCILWGAGSAVLPVAASPMAVDQDTRTISRFDFESDNALADWQGSESSAVQLLPGYDGSQSIRIERPAASGIGSTGVKIPLSPERLSGVRVRIQAMVKAENVAEPPNSWNGIECMLYIRTASGSQWIQPNNVFGTFDWKPIGIVANLPPGILEASLTLGMEKTHGTVWFDDVQLTVLGHIRDSVTDGSQLPHGPILSEKPYKGHNLPRLRGAMIGKQVTAEELEVLGGKWNANHVRWQLLWGGFPNGPADNATVDEYRDWLESKLDELDRLIPVCRRLGIHVLIDVHTPPGGRMQNSVMRMFHEKAFQDAFIDNWETIARRYRGNETIWGYDLVNEPVEGIVPPGVMDWPTLAEHTAKRVRAIDPDHAIIIEPGPWGSPAGFDYMEPIDVTNVVYSFHMYQPHNFTHQGVRGTNVGVTYPGEIDGMYWDKEQLRRAMRPAIEFQRDYGVHMYVGEFSAIRWAPGDSAQRYLKDVIDLLEEYEWDWAYHAFREWDGWSVEHGPDPDDHQPASEPTSRELLLRSWYEKNEK